MSESLARPALSASRAQLWAELVVLFVGVPLAMLVWFEELRAARALFPVILGLAGVALFLLWRTPGWRFRDLWRGPVLSEWPLFLGFAVVTAVISVAIVFAMNPDYFLYIVARRPEIWLMIMVAYPLLSALPQEIIYRTLFFERYQGLFPSVWMALAVNGALFAWGHLFYDNWIAIAMTAGGGLVMAYGYLRHRSTITAWVLHTISGNIIFTASLGPYFYSGMVGA